MTTTTETTTTTTTSTSADGGSCDQSDLTCQQPNNNTNNTDDTTGDTADTADDGGVGDVADSVGDAVTAPAKVGGDVAGVVAGEAVDAVTAGPMLVLDQAAQDMAGTAFGDMAETLNDASEPDFFSLGPIQTSIHVASGLVAFAAIATTLLVAVIVPWRRYGTRLWWATGATARFLLISAFGVSIAVAAVDLSHELTGESIQFAIPDDGIDTSEANLYTGALASIIVPLVGVMFDFQAWLLGVFIMFWPLAAAISITRSFRHALPIMTALIAANVIWPPLAALAIAKSLTALPDISAATWWAAAAVAVAVITNLFALAARSNT